MEENFDSAGPNINFNPLCRSLSRSSLYAHPALTVTPQVLKKVLDAKQVEGFMRVKRQRHHTANLLVGNTTQPEFILFAHMDSVDTGAIDNASGVSILLGTLSRRPDLLRKHLFVFAACEEMSFDMPTYWGYGFRVFEKRLPQLFRQAQSIVAVDGLGFGPTLYESGTESTEVYMAFPITQYEALKHKIYLMGASYTDLLPVYHSLIDDGRLLKEHWLQSAEQLLVTKLLAVAKKK